MKGKVLCCLMACLILIGGLAAVSCTPAAPVEKQAARLSIASGSIGGSSNLYANAFAGILKKYMSIDATVLTYPTAQCPVAMGIGEVDIAYSNSMQSYDPYKGTGIRQGKEPMPGMREWMPLAVSPLQIFVPVDSKIKTFRDLVGQRIGPGTKGMGPESTLSVGLPAIGLNWEKDFTVVYSSHQEGGSNLVAGKMAAYMVTSEAPQPTLAETDMVRPLRLIGFTEQDVKAIAAAVPGLLFMQIPPKFYHMTEPVWTTAHVSHILAMSDFSEDIIYGLVKNSVEHSDVVGYYHTGLGAFLKDTELGLKKWVEASPAATPIPFHKGAIRYYQEIGWKVPAERIPPEAK